MTAQAARAESDPYIGMTAAQLRELGYPDVVEDEFRWHQYCRALDRVAAERKRAEAAETRKLKKAGVAMLESGCWLDHFIWLHRQFGDRAFTARGACDRGYGDPGWAAPPGFRVSLIDPDAGRQLGMAWCRIARRAFDGAWIEPGSVSRGVRRWQVTVKDDPA